MFNHVCQYKFSIHVLPPLQSCFVLTHKAPAERLHDECRLISVIVPFLPMSGSGMNVMNADNNQYENQIQFTRGFRFERQGT